MLPTPRLLWLLLLAAPLIALSAFVPGLVWIAVVYLGAVAALAVSDALLAPRPAQLELERVHDARLSLGAENLITVILANASPRPVAFTLRDEHPHEFPADATLLTGTIAPYEVYEARYHVRPLRRGDYAFGDLVLRYRGPLGAIVRQARYPAATPVKVYPNVLELRKYDLLARKGLLHELGLRPARVYGPGGEFERLRDYTPDDEFRRISWKATARRGKLIAADFETERSQHVLCAIDCGRLMAPPVGDLMRLDYAVNTALMLSYVAGLRGDQVGMLAFADSVRAYVAPRRGKPQFQLLLETLYNLQPEPVESDHGEALSYLARRQRRRTLIVLFTDLATPEAAASNKSRPVRIVRRMVRHSPGVDAARPRVGPAASFESSGLVSAGPPGTLDTFHKVGRGGRTAILVSPHQPARPVHIPFRRRTLIPLPVSDHGGVNLRGTRLRKDPGGVVAGRASR